MYMLFNLVTKQPQRDIITYYAALEDICKTRNLDFNEHLNVSSAKMSLTQFMALSPDFYRFEDGLNFAFDNELRMFSV